jgi:hypothetical protein
MVHLIQISFAAFVGNYFMVAPWLTSVSFHENDFVAEHLGNKVPVRYRPAVLRRSLGHVFFP